MGDAVIYAMVGVILSFVFSEELTLREINIFLGSWVEGYIVHLILGCNRGR